MINIPLGKKKQTKIEMAVIYSHQNSQREKETKTVLLILCTELLPKSISS
jgi:hypothetical protein